MEKENLLVLINIIREKYPERADELADKLNDVKRTLDKTIGSIVEEMQNQIANRDFDIQELSKPANELELMQNEIKDLIYSLNPNYEEKEENITDTENNKIESNEEENKKNKNYSDFEVDNTIPHSLNEPFTHRRPFGYNLLNSEIKEIKTWKDLFSAACENLIEINEEKFLSFENNEEMKGRTGKYFSINSEEIKDPININDRIYVESIKSGEAIRILIIKMLKEFDINIEDFKIYLRADYTNMNV